MPLYVHVLLCKGFVNVPCETRVKELDVYIIDLNHKRKLIERKGGIASE